MVSVVVTVTVTVPGSTGGVVVGVAEVAVGVKVPVHHAV